MLKYPKKRKIKLKRTIKKKKNKQINKKKPNKQRLILQISI